jgi:hypothetical protein
MVRPRASRRQLGILVVLLCGFALLLWGMAFFLNSDHIMVNGRKVTKNDPAFQHSMIRWRIMMGFGGGFSLFMARLCYKIARTKRLE